jgi:hypothetical protein
MRVRLLACLLVCSVLAQPAKAQQADESDAIAPQLQYPVGSPELVARAMLDSLKLRKLENDRCWEIGCVVIVNESSSFQVIGFYVQTAGRDGRARWSSNQFGNPLQPKRATFRFKSGNAEMCDLPVRFILRRPGSKDRLELNGRMSLCKSPHVDSLVQIRTGIPQVTVDGS